MQAGKWLSEEALDVVGKRRKAKGKGEEERYTHLNAELQRLTRRDKKAFKLILEIMEAIFTDNFGNERISS